MRTLRNAKNESVYKQEKSIGKGSQSPRLSHVKKISGIPGGIGRILDGNLGIPGGELGIQVGHLQIWTIFHYFLFQNNRFKIDTKNCFTIVRKIGK